jgi:hypothetical protein
MASESQAFVSFVPAKAFGGETAETEASDSGGFYVL